MNLPKRIRNIAISQINSIKDRLDRVDAEEEEREIQRRYERDARAELDDLQLVTLPLDERLIALDAALARLEQIDARKSHIIVLRYFAGQTELEVAEILGVALRTVKRDWELAKAWLHRELTEGNQR